MKKNSFIRTISILTAISVISGCSSSRSDSDIIIKAMTENRPEAAITVGIWDNGKTDYFVYGENGKLLPSEQLPYAIGSVTKTFSGAYIAKLEHEGRLNIENHVSSLLPIEPQSCNPTLKQLLTHTSGLSDQWEQELAKDSGVVFSRDKMLSVLKEQPIKNGEYASCYSNYGAALAATAAANIEGKSGQEALSGFIKNDLGLENTEFKTAENLAEFFRWQNDDEMALSGGLISNAADMLQYGRLYLENQPPYLQKAAAPIQKFSDDYDCGYFWLTDAENDIVWHNGELCFEDESGEEIGYQSFIGFSKGRNKVVTVLSNVIGYDDDQTALTDLLGYILLLEE